MLYDATTAAAGDARFFGRSGPHGLIAVALAAECETPDSDRMMEGVAPLQSAGPQHVSFLDNRRYADALAETRAGAVIIRPDLLNMVPAGCVPLVTEDPYVAWARVAGLFHPAPPVRPGVHPSAVVDSSASVDPSAEVGPNAVIGAGASVGARCRIGPCAVIGEAVSMGPDCRIGANVSVSHAILGARVHLFPGVRVGQEGFGFATVATGFLTVPQLGRVLIEDDVEVGANSCIDRGSSQDTVIGAGSRLDNLVQIGHNVRLGRCCVVVALAGISGSAVLEDFVVIAGQAGVAGHLRIGRKARVGAQAGVTKDIEAGADVIGSPAEPAREFFRVLATLRKLARKPKVTVTAPDNAARGGMG